MHAVQAELSNILDSAGQCKWNTIYAPVGSLLSLNLAFRVRAAPARTGRAALARSAASWRDIRPPRDSGLPRLAPIPPTRS